MPRIGVQFERPAPAVQASLDKFVFGLIRRKAEAKRPLHSQGGDERRLAPRVELGDAERLTATVLGNAPLAALRPASRPGTSPGYPAATATGPIPPPRFSSPAAGPTGPFPPRFSTPAAGPTGPTAPATLAPASGQSLKVLDISTTGCGLDSPAEVLQMGQRVRLRLLGAGCDLELVGKVVWIR